MFCVLTDFENLTHSDTALYLTQYVSYTVHSSNISLEIDKTDTEIQV